jgi:hypothetical protein
MSVLGGNVILKLRFLREPLDTLFLAVPYFRDLGRQARAAPKGGRGHTRSD